MVEHTVLARALVVNFTISIAWWPVYVYYSYKYNTYGLNVVGIVLLIWYMFGYHTYNTVKMNSNIRSCIYEKFPSPSEECWEMDKTWVWGGY